MCGRYQLRVDLDLLLYRYGIKGLDTEINYNGKNEIFPSYKVPAILKDKKKKIDFIKWGFPSEFSNSLIINARSETVDVKPTFKNSFINRRCLIPANSFYEWDKKGRKNEKYKIYLKDENIFSMAGIWSIFQDKEGRVFKAFTILTTSANKEMGNIHNRMPVIIPREKEELWISDDIKDIKTIKELLNSFEGEIIIEKVVEDKQLTFDDFINSKTRT
ncbi:SOS response-associated peptidase [Thermohalobacter berrensis]|uniref:Abasic site processing protein n=1 Tax=Thermohalobacter berrensis TaxID=99594 RepID=A0A419SUT4_9FIRM|nr:SOS response-associated peptidase [Thermohalobacter berrensis]RKD28976.1 hypothetical protein BET03_06385 [Thermohalobacter berrensis]